MRTHILNYIAMPIISHGQLCSHWLFMSGISQIILYLDLLGHFPYFASGVSQQRNVAQQKNKPLAMREDGIAVAVVGPYRAKASHRLSR